MVKLRALLVACLIGVGVLAAPAAAQAAPGDTAVGCSVPSGWVAIAYTRSNSCVGVGLNAYVVEQVDGFPIGYSLATCSTPLPPGWAVTFSGFYMSQCNLNTTGAGYGWVIRRLS